MKRLFLFTFFVLQLDCLLAYPITFGIVHTDSTAVYSDSLQTELIDYIPFTEVITIIGQDSLHDEATFVFNNLVKIEWQHSFAWLQTKDVFITKEALVYAKSGGFYFDEPDSTTKGGFIGKSYLESMPCVIDILQHFR